MVKLVCIDVDGTLVGTGGRVAERVWPAAAAVAAAGIHLALCSGRPVFGVTRSYAERLDAHGWHAFQNGASIVCLPTNESRSTYLSPAVVTDLKARATRTGRILELYSDYSYAVESRSERAARHAGLLGIPFAPGSFDALDAPIVRAQWLLPLDEVEIEAILREPHEGFEVTPSTSLVMPDTRFVNLTPPGIDKASAVRVLAGIHGCSVEEVMYVGDDLNDVEALRIVGFPVAMGNADPAARVLARHHVGHVDAGGLADALALAIAS